MGEKWGHWRGAGRCGERRFLDRKKKNQDRQLWGEERGICGGRHVWRFG